MKTFRQMLDFGTSFLLEKNIKESEANSRELLMYLCNLSYSDFILSLDKEVNEKIFEMYKTLLKKRAENTPIQYITGKQCFYGLDFYVDENVLIPRLDTEVLVENIINREINKDISILDMCTGSGCIAISLKKFGDFKEVLAVDISPKALEIAKKNAVENEVNIEFLKSNMFSSLDKCKKFDVIVSNPPYISKKELESLERQVKDFEPKLALLAGDNGLEFYKIIAETGKRFLKENGRMYLEIGCNQAKEVTKILNEQDFKEIEVIKELAKLDRVIVSRT